MQRLQPRKRWQLQHAEQLLWLWRLQWLHWLRLRLWL